MVRSLLLGAILALSLGANAQMGGGPGGGGGQGGGGGGCSWSDKRDPNNTQCYDPKANCSSFDRNDVNNTLCYEPPPPCTEAEKADKNNNRCYVKPVASCELKINNSIAKPSDINAMLTKSSADELKADGTILSEFYWIQPVCEVKNNSSRTIKGNWFSGSRFTTATGLQTCQYGGGGWCIEDTSKSITKEDTLEVNKKTVISGTLLLRNKGGTGATLRKDDVKFKVEIENGTGDEASLPKDIVVVSDTASAPTCRVIVSGAVDTSIPQTENALIEVTNGAIEFRAIIDNAVGDAARADQTVWSGGPSQNGRWETAPPGQVSTVSAQVTNRKGDVMKCSLRVKPQAQGFIVNVNKFGDCAFFTELRNYYFLNNTNKAFQTDPFSPTIKYPGIDAQYGESSPEVPFAGILNGAASTDGVIVAGMNGAISMPPVMQRKYSKAIIVAKVFDAKSSTVGSDAIYWGVLDYSNYAKTRLIPTEDAEGVKDEDTIVFQMYLAGSQPGQMMDARGQAGQVPFYDFIPAGEGGRPFDKIVPFMTDSCIPMFQISMPQRQGKAMTPALKSAVSCTYSRPYKFSDLKKGLVNLTALHLVPEHAQHQFPTDLLKASFQPPCVAQNPNDTTACWDIKASQFGQSSATEPFKTHEACRTTEVVGYSACDRYGCYNTSAPQTVCRKKGRRKYCTTVNTPVTRVSYKASCNVIESANECTSNLAIRFSGYNQMSTAALGCAVKYGRSGEVISPTLGPVNKTNGPFNGIIPYTAFGGSAPKDFSDYPSSLMSRENGNSGANMGYACIPCRFATNEAAASRDIYATTGPIPVDQDATTARKPLFSFSKLTAPRECVRKISMEVRYFGSAACDGVNAPPGNFCSSENISQQSCPAKDASTGGGNVAGKFDVDVCPGSGFEYDSVSVSWSPIIVDVAGNGIQISRDFQYAVKFDIKGNGSKSIIDWPINTREVAFLVRKNKAGTVNSIKELFGDYKAKNGFEALRPYDSNKDGSIDAKDKRNSELSLWFDYNRNAVVDEGELVSLEEAGIESISLKYTKPLSKGIEGKTLSSIYFNRKSNRFMNIEDHYFYEYLKNGKLIDKKTAKKPGK